MTKQNGNGKYNITPEEYELLEKNNIKVANFILRISKYGWDRERALTTPPTPRFTLTDEQKAIMRKNKVSYHTARSRVIEWHWPIEKAITEPPEDRVKTTPEQRAVMKENKVSSQLLSKRLKRGWTIDEAIHLKPGQPREIYRELFPQT